MTEASFLTSLLSGGLVSCWCSPTLSFNSNEQESECGIINYHMLFSWRSCFMCHDFSWKKNCFLLSSEQCGTFKCNHNQAGTSLSMSRDSIFWSGRHSCGCLPLPAGHNQNQAAVSSGDLRMRMVLHSLIGCLIKPTSIWFYVNKKMILCQSVNIQSPNDLKKSKFHCVFTGLHGSWWFQ